jgi:uncharacterized protein (TIGR02300 family)
MASAAIETRGLKRACASCGVRFYDLNKRPIMCPNCSTEFTGEIKLKTRRGRGAVAAIAEVAAAPVANDQFEEAEVIENTISLEEVEEDGVVPEDEEDALEGGDLEGLEEIEEDLEDDLDVEVEKE